MLKVYGHPASQPSRSVIWACVLKELPIKLILPDVEGNEGINPRGQIPTIDDAGFILTEMPAILAYLGDKHRWLDLYPADLVTRARIAQYLHAHHSLTRLATTKLMAPHVLVAYGGIPNANPLSYANNLCIQASMDDGDRLANGQQLIAEVINCIEHAYLQNHDFIGGTTQASIADLACYEEIGQLEQANLFDLSENKLMHTWVRRMRELPYHDEVHRYNTALGDIQSTPNSMERFSDAVNQAFTTLSALPHIEFE